MSYKYENRYIRYDLTPIFRQNLISLMWNKDSEKKRSNSGTKFVPFKLYLVHRRSLEKISSYFRYKNRKKLSDIFDTMFQLKIIKNLLKEKLSII
jgi:hypothetical protein